MSVIIIITLSWPSLTVILCIAMNQPSEGWQIKPGGGQLAPESFNNHRHQEEEEHFNIMIL